MTALHAIVLWLCWRSGNFGRVCRTQLANRTSELLLVENAPISDMLFDSQSSALWVTTASSSVKRYSTLNTQLTHKPQLMIMVHKCLMISENPPCQALLILQLPWASHHCMTAIYTARC